ncbi:MULTISPECIES: TIGR03749 family integrating conjugative element protein [unclassified Halomonas]|uniref:TIGR03749 family integrating conjugative element protein n=1 Tax=unclassified Halomonas TaxID=2609666 RepID=UPI0028877CD8|nr:MULTISPECIES: TIGR03749 family integrating conjugative element protein [unclassified Halomonas]MDT0501289.1 TIGR03749 family integrating conjugative element protein [Halomonas sp. PAR7]MDT0512187.1 TIGR03749 family integrating conjugative element protein [Halomonas sp. LES1]MDT0590676.1 TIGR03749 family integrating conjugative element protein [Halomonas sp. PAR8]
MKRVMLAWLVTAVFAGEALAVEVMHWERRPLAIPLPVDEERIVTLDRNVRVGLPPALANPEVLRVQSAGGVLYLKAFETFETQRVRVQDVESGDVLLLDLSAGEGVSSEEILVVDSRESSTASSSSGSGGAKTVSTPPSSAQASGTAAQRASTTPVPVLLTRHAAQSLYAPQRTIEPLRGVSRVPMRLPESLSTLLPSLPVTATPLGAWRLDGWMVTAVKLENNDRRRAFELDPRWLQGDFYSATFMHPYLAPRGSMEDTTTVFLVTRRRGLGRALIPLEAMEETEEGTS